MTFAHLHSRARPRPHHPAGTWGFTKLVLPFHPEPSSGALDRAVHQEPGGQVGPVSSLQDQGPPGGHQRPIVQPLVGPSSYLSVPPTSGLWVRKRSSEPDPLPWAPPVPMLACWVLWVDTSRCHDLYPWKTQPRPFNAPASTRTITRPECWEDPPWAVQVGAYPLCREPMWQGWHSGWAGLQPLICGCFPHPHSEPPCSRLPSVCQPRGSGLPPAPAPSLPPSLGPALPSGPFALRMPWKPP